VADGIVKAETRLVLGGRRLADVLVNIFGTERQQRIEKFLS